MEPFVFGKMPNDRSSTSIECDFWTVSFFPLFQHILCYCVAFAAVAVAIAVFLFSCCCKFCVSARDISLCARDSATTFDECINIHIICVCQWTRVLVIIRPLIMTHWLSHTPYTTQRRRRKIHYFSSKFCKHLLVIRFQRKS